MISRTFVLGKTERLCVIIYPMEYLITGVLGLLVGSFLNVCIYRLPKGRSVVAPASACAECGKKLTAAELIPVLSYLFLRGKCRGCGKPISFRYPAVEALTALLFLACLWRFGVGTRMVFGTVFASILVAASFIDLDTMELPDSASLACAATGLLYGLAVKQSLLYSLYGAAAGFLIMYIIGRAGSALYKKEAMGGGDIKLMAGAGAFLGWQGVLLAIYLGFLTALVFLLPALLTGARKRQDAVPFGPALAAGAFAAFLFGDLIWHWYLGML